MKLLICGGAGFIGSNFIHYFLEQHPDSTVVNYDKLTYAGNVNNLSDITENPVYTKRYQFVQGDITDRETLCRVVEEFGITHLINFAAETHVDRSIQGECIEFVMSNTLGVLTLLNLVKKYNLKKMVNVSTDEVYGALTLDSADAFTEKTPFAPNMPYAAAKAGGDLMCHAYFATHRLPVVVTHCSNNYGRYQYPEKLIPSSIFKVLKNQPITIYGNGKNVRDWIHVVDHCVALDLLLYSGVDGEVYNIGAENERDNIEIAQLILRILKKPADMFTFVADRPGHDLRYAVNANKIKQLGWSPHYNREKFETGLSETITWYLEHQDWVEKLIQKHAEAEKVNTYL